MVRFRVKFQEKECVSGSYVWGRKRQSATDALSFVVRFGVRENRKALFYLAYQKLFADYRNPRKVLKYRKMPDAIFCIHF